MNTDQRRHDLSRPDLTNTYNLNLDYSCCCCPSLREPEDKVPVSQKRAECPRSFSSTPLTSKQNVQKTGGETSWDFISRSWSSILPLLCKIVSQRSVCSSVRVLARKEDLNSVSPKPSETLRVNVLRLLLLSFSLGPRLKTQLKLERKERTSDPEELFKVLPLSVRLLVSDIDSPLVISIIFCSD